jgi:inner membrane protein
MDILTHILSGVAVGSLASSFSKSGWIDKLKIIAVSAFAAALPDFDAISLWSGFDSSFGKLFSLPASGREIYSGKYWYSHHAFLHSIPAVILFAGVLGFVFYLFESKIMRGKDRKLLGSIRKNRIVLIAFVLGFLVHLLEDMPTPASTWGGVNLFWPNSSYIGGNW